MPRDYWSFFHRKLGKAKSGLNYIQEFEKFHHCEPWSFNILKRCIVLLYFFLSMLFKCSFLLQSRVFKYSFLLKSSILNIVLFYKVVFLNIVLFYKGMTWILYVIVCWVPKWETLITKILKINLSDKKLLLQSTIKKYASWNWIIDKSVE